ncbi:MAG: hypothetical protein EZS26_001976 [Candidatus Ordinivivax streblomastigis]|uniref:Antitoxin n=1 Tax=Candidatus Ordinivivax streblomastigis TaxID=2540710 RepID=A0A5M8P065_9BACT|nr:MAG: hypothetical protein EZS26_001976 [Candidatus Ordinivivax streblomastigis]
MISTVKLRRKNVVNAFAILLDNLNYAEKKTLADYLFQSIEKEQSIKEQDFYSLYGAWKSDSSAEEIIAEIKNSRRSGKTRIIESFD